MCIVCVLLMTNPDIIVLFDIDNTLFNTTKFKESEHSLFELYEEVEEILETIAKVATLGIFSQGEVAFQKKKLEETNIARYFFEEHTHIVQYKLEVMKEVFEKYKSKAKIYFIDDWLDSLRLAKEAEPSVFTIWMKRGEYVASQEQQISFKPDAAGKNLQEIIPLIKNN